MSLKEKRNLSKINKLKRQILHNYITNKEISTLLLKSIDNIDYFEYALKISCNVMSVERLQLFRSIACNEHLINSDYYKQALDIFISYKNSRNLNQIITILSNPKLINSNFYPFILELFRTNENIDYTTSLINRMIIENNFSITSFLFSNLIHFDETTNNEIYSISQIPKIGKIRFLKLITNLCKGEDIEFIEKNINQVLILIRKILVLNDDIAIKNLFNHLCNDIEKIINNENVLENFDKEIINQIYEIAKNKSLK